ncbi:putative 5-oxoprolinase (ATP-hydrolyzing) [Mesorhizobium plurifarium]|uniref:Putative 5-oxoprolinase (ATP-hydrolyzing) n=1 Tax=Mesorhizobium plurifarium TaxID=69974 RepID=A0A0K2W0S8_MESPL|nr:putative 5-oxoprolinase (ATP-hydrolyzing) [Mesorhizobium plurifarium]
MNIAVSHPSEARRRAASLLDGYMPGEKLIVDPSVAFHRDYEKNLDPVTYEVLRSKFWNLNWDHQEALRRASGSLVVVYGFDFNTSIQTEEGEGVVFGPGNLFFAGCADLCVKWTLEHRSGGSGINPGDVFIQNDPWVGTNHQMDTAVFAPVFVDGKLFAWVYNVVHQRELGGLEPGGFVQQAQDVYSEATFMPPIKIVDRGELREDVLDMWVRRSRLPDLMTLETKAQLAGVQFAKRRLEEMIERYGAGVVKGAMRGVIDNAARTVGRRLEKLPDATWGDLRYVAGSSPGDKNLYKLGLTFEKRGDRLLVTNEGTDRSVGSFNITRGVLRAVIANVFIPLLAYDQFLCGAGVLRQIDFLVEGGDRITSARHPAAVSTSIGMCTAGAQAHYLAAKMLSADPELGAHVFAASCLHTLVVNQVFGRDENGVPYANFPFDSVVGAIGAFTFRDGIDHGGGILSMMNPVGSCEGYEREIPFLYLYRKEMPASGGHGQFRGGCSFVSGFTGHRTDHAFISSGGLFQTVTQGLGLVGGFPATAGLMRHATGTDVPALLAGGRLPGGSEELEQLVPDLAPPPTKKFDNRLAEGDVFESWAQPGAGYGDPLLRDPQLVASDASSGRLLDGDALRIYGVVLNDAGSVDADATAQAREKAYEQRLSQAGKPRRPGLPRPSGKVIGKVLATVNVCESAEGPVLACSHCGTGLGTGETGYRAGCAELDMPLPSISPYFGDPSTQVTDALVFRRFLCPSCGSALDGVICRPADEPFNDITVTHEGTRS